MPKILVTILLLAVIFLAAIFYPQTDFIPVKSADPSSSIVLPALPSPSPSLSPTPMSYSQMNKLYGPCINLPVLTYHHVQSREKAVENKQTAISVDTQIFHAQMKYLKEKGYTIIGPQQLIAFFDKGIVPGIKPVLITFDDGYADFYSDALEILHSYSFPAIVFLSTGLMNNYGYLNWSEIGDASGRGIYFANHTWSHKNLKQNLAVVESEIVTADTQLNERNLNQYKIFAYPYGIVGKETKKVLEKIGYAAAFTTENGSVLCKGLRMTLPRIRIGNRNFPAYGL